MSQFDSLTGAELHQLSEKLYHAVTRLFDAASATFTQMTAMGTWTQDYAELNARAGVLLAAGRDLPAAQALAGDVRLVYEEIVRGREHAAVR